MRTLIAMSGGVDSSTAAYLIKNESDACVGGMMHLTGDTADAEAARAVAKQLEIPFYVFDLRDEFRQKVIDRFISTYEAGGTPNPCIDCNRYMKFGRLSALAAELGCDTIATGHYAKTGFDEISGRWQLLRAENREKDQSYVLYTLTQEMLAHVRFPLGSFQNKAQIRTLAEKLGFQNADQPDSQDICFVPGGKYADFISGYTGKEYLPGHFVDEEGKILGEHRGLIRYTIGQRKGLGLALPEPMYVRKKDTGKNEVILSREDALFSNRLIADDFNWIWAKDWKKYADPAHPDVPKTGSVFCVTAKPRYRAKEAPAEAKVLEGGRVEIVFSEPQRALTVGQSVVLYDGECVVGGGKINEVL